jgi:hypothetical protein
MMTAAQLAAMKPGDSALVRATLMPRGVNGNAGDHLQIAITGAGVLWVPISQIVDVEHIAPMHGVVADLCSEQGRAKAA